jgi:hypothetical protein
MKAHGVKTVRGRNGRLYHYHRATGTRLHGNPESPNFLIQIGLHNERANGRSKVYFLVAGQYVKIGYTNDRLENRIVALQPGNPLPLKLFAWIYGSARTEKALHREFADFRRCGEWFFFAPRVRQRIEYLSQNKNPSERKMKIRGKPKVENSN